MCGLAHKNFYAAVTRTAFCSAIGGDRLVGATAFRLNAAAADAALHQIVTRAVGTVERQRVVDGIRTGAVGMADDAHLSIGAAAQAFGKAVQNGRKVALDVVATCIICRSFR